MVNGLEGKLPVSLTAGSRQVDGNPLRLEQIVLTFAAANRLTAGSRIYSPLISSLQEFIARSGAHLDDSGVWLEAAARPILSRRRMTNDQFRMTKECPKPECLTLVLRTSCFFRHWTFVIRISCPLALSRPTRASRKSRSFWSAEVPCCFPIF
ncbi:MAG: hypothetical protein JWO95_738 [Verrucomicrobiales bacterium]|nr:hypothetical protein [Verrucomicrobiales bacterium]